MIMGTPLHKSPKRKRDAAETEHYSPPASPTSSVSVASLQEARLMEAEEIGRHSPRTVVAGRLKELAIRESSFNPEMNRSNTAARLQESAHDERRFIAETVEQSPPSSTEEQVRRDGNSPQETDEQQICNLQPQATKNLERKTSRKRVKPVPGPSRSRKKVSPPPPAENVSPNPLTWSDCEITGHNPTDPNDDGYGINGIGFKPTAAIAWARSQQRQKQVADWKHREAREAREKRRERREGMVQAATPHEAAGVVQKKVKFDLG